MEVPDALVRFAPPVARTLARHPDLIPSVVARSLPSREELVARAVAAAESSSDAADLMRGLRRLKYAVVGALVLHDLQAGVPAVDRVGAVLADLADALAEGALHFASGGAPEGFVVFAMGKHGAGELNYSSDIDLIYVARTLDGDEQRAARRLGRLLSEVTPDGFCFRVDLNLRPEGRAGPLVVSLAAAEHHYLTFGRTWERAAWLKARPAAGDLALGAELLHTIEPFRFRRHLDFGTLEDLAAMRDRIAASARLDTLQRDLKRGPGGIRELEFLVQATQLAWIGRDPELRIRATVPAIEALDRKGVLPDGLDPDRLVGDYRLLRAIEHRVQWEAEAQTQQLPAATDEAGWERLAATLGRTDPVDLQGEVAAARGRVEAAWERVFTPEESDDPLTLVDPFASVDERTQELAALGFRDAEAASERIGRLAEPTAQQRMRPSTWRRFERVAPRLASLAARSSDPDAALARIERFVARVGARGTTYELLHENPGAMETLVRLFADSPFLSERFLHHPELLDALVLRGRGGELGPRGARELIEELGDELAVRDDEEGLLLLRTRQTMEMLRIGLADLGGALPDLPCPHLVALAEAILAGADTLARAAMATRHGVLRAEDGVEVPRAIVGLGSLGSGWMTYGSDLDLVFVSRSEGASDGPRSLDGRTFSARHVQRAITALTAATREGRCYEVDLRLRPGGAGGPLCTSFVGLRRWYTDHAAPWERLVLSRARVVYASDPRFGEEVGAALDEARLGVDPEVLVEEARTMRRRQLAEVSAERPGVLDLKLGPGGLTDIEFAVACRQVGLDAPSEPDPVAALAALPDPSPGDGATLAEHYRVFRRVEGHLRLRTGTDAAHLHLARDEAALVASAAGFPSADALGADLVARREQVANIVDRWMKEAATKC